MTRETFTVAVEVTAEDAPEGYSNERLADAIRDGVFATIGNMAGLDPVVMQVWGPSPEPVTVELDLDVTVDAPQQKVWVATISDENDSPGPAVYVSDTDDHLITVIRQQQGIPDDAELLEWLDDHGKTAVWDSYYVETGEE